MFLIFKYCTGSSALISENEKQTKVNKIDMMRFEYTFAKIPKNYSYCDV